MPRKIPGNVRNKEGSVDLHYTEKRQKNNDAVKKSREKTRQKAKETMEKVTQLKQENEMLEERIKLLAKELTFLKDIFMAHAGSAHGITVDDMEIKGLLEEDEVNLPAKCSNGNYLRCIHLLIFPFFRT